MPDAIETRGAAPPLGDIALVFLRLGVTAFGGPAAHIAMMENEFVRRRHWVTHERFLDLLGAANLIPGPSSTELAIYIGFEQAGALGLLVAGTCFILPAALMVGAIAWAYVRFGALPELASGLYGIKPVVIGVVVQALWGLAPKAVKKSRLLGAIGICACIATAFGVDALLVLLAAGIATVLARRASRENVASPLFFANAVATGSVAATSAAPASLLALFLTFVKIGALVFGSGYVLLAFLRAELVDGLHWLTEPQLLDAVAVGQVTPGPVFTTATFIGYLIAGPKGAALATLGIFLPGFVLVALTRPLLARVRKSPTAASFLDGVNVASVALMVVVTAQLGRAAIVDLPTALIALVSAALLVRWKINSTWLVAGGAVVGVVARGWH